MTRKEMMSRMDAQELMEWSLFFKIRAEQEQQEMLRQKATQKLNARPRGGLRHGGN